MKKKIRVLIIVQNLPLPFDRRVWQEANTLREAGCSVAIICPKGKGYEKSHEKLNSIDIYRHPLPLEAKGALGYILEYGVSLFWEFLYSCRICVTHGFDVIHACNPPDTIFLIGGFFKLFGKKFLFDHHDINPELYEAKFNKRGLFYRLLVFLEKMTFLVADISIATNDSYREIAITRGGMSPGKVYVVRSGPDLTRLVPVPANHELKNGSKYLVGYVGVIGQQEGIDILLRVIRKIVGHYGRRDILFILVGGGPALDEMKSYSRELGLDEFVKFTGRVPDRDLLEILCTSDVCVNPDTPNEMNEKSTMNKIMEYMALGKPIVQFDLKEGRVSAQKASLYARKNDERDMAEKIIWILEHPKEAKEMGAYGKKRVHEKLAWKYEAPKLLKAYHALFNC